MHTFDHQTQGLAAEDPLLKFVKQWSTDQVRQTNMDAGVEYI